MYTTYHFKSAAEINVDILNAIKTAFKERPVVITIEEDEGLSIPEGQKQFVRQSIEKYKTHPELLVNEDDAWKIIDSD